MSCQYYIVPNFLTNIHIYIKRKYLGGRMTSCVVFVGRKEQALLHLISKTFQYDFSRFYWNKIWICQRKNQWQDERIRTYTLLRCLRNPHPEIWNILYVFFAAWALQVPTGARWQSLKIPFFIKCRPFYMTICYQLRYEKWIVTSHRTLFLYLFLNISCHYILIVTPVS